jgi:hypothetical protein
MNPSSIHVVRFMRGSLMVSLSRPGIVGARFTGTAGSRHDDRRYGDSDTVTLHPCA